MRINLRSFRSIAHFALRNGGASSGGAISGEDNPTIHPSVLDVLATQTRAAKDSFEGGAKVTEASGAYRSNGAADEHAGLGSAKQASDVFELYRQHRSSRYHQMIADAQSAKQ